MFKYYQPLIVHNCYMTPSKKHFIWTKEMPKKLFKMKDLDTNNHYQYKKVKCFLGKNILSAPNKYKKKCSKIKDLDITKLNQYTYVM